MIKKLKLKKEQKKEYLDSLYVLELQLADNLISDEEFNEQVDLLKSLYEREQNG